mgnify:FL=1
MNLRYQNNSGLSLIEVLIAMAILAFISVRIYEITTRTFALREYLAQEGDFYNSVRLSMNILGRDIASIYSPLFILPEKAATPPGQTASTDPNEARLQTELAMGMGDLGRVTTFWLGALDKTGVRPSRFIGSDSKISFVAVSHMRVYRDTKESNFARIVYQLEPDSENKEHPDARVLVKFESSNAFDDDEKNELGNLKTPLLHGIKKLQFRFFKKEKEETVRAWDNEKEEFLKMFPDKVLVDLEAYGPGSLTFEGTYAFRPEIPFRPLDASH